MKSMTGYGRGVARATAREVVLEITSVNRRNLEVVVSLPGDWPELERTLADRMRAFAGRGRVAIHVRDCAAGDQPGGWDQERLRRRLQELRALVEAESGEFTVTPELIVRLAHLETTLAPTTSETEDSWREPILEAFSEACGSWEQMRRAEGSELERDLRQRLAQLRTWLEAIETCSADSVPAYRERLLERLRQAGLDLDLADERVLKEIALFADRCDVAEEVTRLRSHFDQLEQTLAEDVPVGRKLDFICQEIHRELNTIGSKANNLDVSRLVIDSKNEWERLREQAANVE